MSNKAIESLREALRHSPENVPLRRHLAEMLLDQGRAAEAETEYRAALALDPDDMGLKCGLADAFVDQGKRSEALVVIEDLLQADGTPGYAYVLHARVLLRAGDLARAARQYRRALDQDPEVADTELGERLGVFENPEEESEVVEGRVRAAGRPAEPDTSGVEVEHPGISFGDVGGMEGVKKEIRRKIILPLEHPELYEAYGKKVGGGILLYGPPGCGKTYLARATAGEVKARFMSIGLHDVLEMWIGQSERNLHSIFEQARSHTPSVLFFDEVDALGASRSDMRQSAGRQLINQFLAEMDGLDDSNEGILILAATNAPWHLDPAFRRPGRFDRILFVPPPDEGARAAILRILLQGKPGKQVDHDRVAARTKRFSGADLKAVVDMAVEDRLEEALESGVPSPITTKDLLKAAKRIKPTTRDWFSTARNYATYANQAGLYDEILDYMEKHK